MAQVRLIQINNGTDADVSHRPSGPGYSRVDPPEGYLTKLGTMWMQDIGKAQAGVTYRINKLPNGYEVWQKPRPAQPSHIDKWCYGHPSGRFFDSPIKFFPHFLSLMQDGNADSCICVNCNKKPTARKKKPASAASVANTKGVPQGWTVLPSRTQGRPPGRPPGRPAAAIDLTEDESAEDNNAGVYKAKGRQWVQGRTDEEGTPDPYRNNIDRLKALGSLDTIIEEPMSADWRAERASGIDKYFKTILRRPAWQPRRMEIVLFVRALEPDERLIFDVPSQRFMITSDGVAGLKEPLWEAGVVTQTAQASQGVIEDSISNSGFRVEPLSNANSKEGKGIWKQYTYVRADQLRPFALWQQLLPKTEGVTWHPTIGNALLVMSTVALAKRYRFKGKWPEAKIYCRAMYLGPELIVEGDFVYLLPEADYDQGVTDVMRVDAITLDVWKLDEASNNDYDEGHPYNSAARITGKIFTIAKDRAYDPEPIELSTLSASTSLDVCGPWYQRTPADKLVRVPVHRVMGRCHDPHIVQQWLEGTQDANAGTVISKLGIALDGVVEGRAHSSAEYRRIDEDRSWFWADTRAEALDLEEINARVVSSQDPNRDPKKYRKEIRVIEGTAKPEERLALQQAERRTLLRNAGNSMVASALEIAAVESKETSRDGKRDRLDSESDAEDEENDDEDAERQVRGDGDVQMEENQFIDQMAEGLAMSDEEVSSGSEDEVASQGQASTQYGTPRSAPMVVIDD